MEEEQIKVICSICGNWIDLEPGTIIFRECFCICAECVRKYKEEK